MACGCGKPNCNGSIESNVGCCGNVSKATPLSSCGTVKNACAEDHCQTIINQQFIATLKILNSWNVPDCGGAATLSVIGLKGIAIGANLWAEQYGYYEVIGFNADNGQITVQNNCIDGNSPEGTNVPACTEFTVTDPPLADGGGGQPSLFPYVAIDFTAPNDGDCILITVTTVNGLVVGKNVQIGSGTYRVSSIPDGTHITICNDGEGITPGTAVIAKNAANQFQYPIILIDANPCTNDEVTSGCIVVCNGDIMSPLGNTTAGQPLAGSVPMVQEDGSCEVAFEFLDIPTRTCATLLCCLTLVSGEDTYVIRVSDTSEFTVGDILQIGTRTDRFTITDIIDATHLEAVVDPVPGATVDIDEGTSICIVDCCEILEGQIEQMLVLTGNVEADPLGSPVLLSSGGTTEALGAVEILSITNTSTLHAMWFHIHMFCEMLFEIENGATDPVQFSPKLHYSLTLNPPPAVVGAPEQLGVLHGDGSIGVTRFLAFSSIAGPVFAGGTVNFVFRASVEWLGFNTAEINVPVNSLRPNMTAFGVAV